VTSIAEQKPGVGTQDVEVVGGIDTHRDTIHVAVVDGAGRQLADREFATTAAGYQAATNWMSGHGRVLAVGVEGTSSYGVGITAALRAGGFVVWEVDRPERRERRRAGKSDPLDAYAAAHAVLSGRAHGTPKTHDGPVEAIRVIKMARSSAVKARTQAVNQLKNALVTAPSELREPLRRLSVRALVEVCARMRPTGAAGEPVTATKLAMRRLARRIQHLDVEIADALAELDELTRAVAPRLREQQGVGADVAATLLVSAGDNPDRLRSEASFARLCGVAPIPASSGRTDRHRLHRGGDRDANRALYVVAITRLAHCPTTRAYAQRRRQQGLSNRDIIRCLKRYIARDLYRHLTIEPTSHRALTTA